LAILSGLLRPSSGQVTALGHDLWQLADRDREHFRLQHCGFIFQGYNLFPALSARQQLELVLRWGKRALRPEARSRAEEFLSLLGLANQAHLRPAELSGGEKQRLACARALIKQPTFCFADEPTSALDWAHGKQIIELLRSAAHHRGATILIVAHDSRIVPYADRVYHLEDGCLREPRGMPTAAADTAGSQTDLSLGTMSTSMPPAEVKTRLRIRRSRLFLALSGLGLLIVSVLGSYWMLERKPGFLEKRGFRLGWNSAKEASSTGKSRLVVCTGYVDVEGGVLSLYPTLPGRVAEVLVRENETVQAGAVLLRLEDQAARYAVQETEAGVQAAEAQFAEAQKAPEQHESVVTQQKAALTAIEHDLVAARLLTARKEQLVKGGHLAREEADASREFVKKLQASEQAEREKLHALKLRDPVQDVARAEADVLAKKALLNKARHALRECSLKAPRDGIVLRILVHSGEVLGASPKQPAVLLCPSGPRIVRAEVEQEFASQVVVGQRADVEDDARNADFTWKGRVVRISDWYAPRRTALPDGLPAQDARTLECLIQLDPNQPPLRIGQRVRVKFVQ
jgi:putative ABC transport system ATP-binding protein